MLLARTFLAHVVYTETMVYPNAYSRLREIHTTTFLYRCVHPRDRREFERDALGYIRVRVVYILYTVKHPREL